MAEGTTSREIELLAANRWWNAALEWAGADRGRLAPLRDLGGELVASPLWALALGGTQLRAGQLGVALLLDAAHRQAPSSYPGLLAALADWRRVDAPQEVGALWRALMGLFIQYAKGLDEKPARLVDVPRLLAAANDSLPWDTSCAVGDDALRNAARAVLDWRNGATHLGRYRLGAWHAAEWCADVAGCTRLSRLSPAIQPRVLFRDLVVVGVTCVVKMIASQENQGAKASIPDPAVMALTRVEVLAPPRIEPVAEAVEAPPIVAPSPPAAGWWGASQRWATARGRRDAGVLIEFSHAFEKRPLWPLVERELQRLSSSAAVRANQRGRVLLAIVFDEFIRPYPHRMDELLDALVPPDDVVLELEHCATFQNLYAAVHDGWARTLAGAEVTGAAVAKRLNMFGGIVPWDQLTGLDEAARVAFQDASIDAAFGAPNPDELAIWRGIYWALVRVRNDAVHGNGQSLRGRVRPTDLRLDMLLFHGLGGLRFRAACARKEGVVMTVPDFGCT